jgi:hypothetical protein
MLSSWAETKTEYEEKDGLFVTKTSDDTMGYYGSIDEETYLGVIIDSSLDANAILARISCIKVKDD